MAPVEDAFKAEKESLEEENRELRRENAQLNQSLRRRRRGDDLIVKATYECFAGGLPTIRVPKIPASRGRGKSQTALLHITDTQAGKVTDTYSLAVLQRRLAMVVEKTTKIVEARRSTAKIDECVLLLGGDMVEGELIYAGQAHEIEQSVFDQAVKSTPALFAKMILQLLEVFKTVRVVGVCGNHGRPASRSAGSHRRTNWDRVFYEVTRMMLLGTDEFPRKELEGRLVFEIPDRWYAHVFVHDWGILLVHGDQIRGGFAGLPWYGFSKKLSGWADVCNVPVDYMYAGHFHTIAASTLNHREWFCGGTTESSNAYAQENMAAAGYPCQRLHFYDAEHGQMSESKLYLTEPGERLPQRRRGG